MLKYINITQSCDGNNIGHNIVMASAISGSKNLKRSTFPEVYKANNFINLHFIVCSLNVNTCVKLMLSFQLTDREGLCVFLYVLYEGRDNF